MYLRTNSYVYGNGTGLGNDAAGRVQWAMLPAYTPPNWPGLPCRIGSARYTATTIVYCETVARSTCTVYT